MRSCLRGSVRVMWREMSSRMEMRQQQFGVLEGDPFPPKEDRSLRFIEDSYAGAKRLVIASRCCTDQCLRLGRCQ